jgi:tryptophan 2,3-dioxygenase
MIIKTRTGSVNREIFYDLMEQSKTSQYWVYMELHKLFSCQKPFKDLCNRDELQFQIVHQIEELLMKLMNYTLFDIIDCMADGQTNKVLTLFNRVNHCQSTLLFMLDFLGTMSPKDYQEIRSHLGQGSAQESPGFKIVLQQFTSLWDAYNENYLIKNSLTLEQVYDREYNHSDAFVVAEALITFEIKFRRFLSNHLEIAQRLIGKDVVSLQGNNIKNLNNRITKSYFPELWKIRSQMTNDCGHDYNVSQE